MQSITSIVLDELGAGLQFAKGALATLAQKPASFLMLPSQALSSWLLVLIGQLLSCFFLVFCVLGNEVFYQ